MKVSMKTSLVLFSYHSHKRGYIEMLFDRLRTAAIGHSLTLERGSLNDLQISIIDSKLDIRESLTNKRLTEFDVVYFELWYKAPQQALAAAQHLDHHKIPFFSKERLTVMPLSKIAEIAKLTDAIMPLPDTCISSRSMIKKVFKSG